MTPKIATTTETEAILKLFDVLFMRMSRRERRSTRVVGPEKKGSLPAPPGAGTSWACGLPHCTLYRKYLPDGRKNNGGIRCFAMDTDEGMIVES
jgi:hypothetical protein